MSGPFVILSQNMARALVLVPLMALFVASGCALPHDSSKGYEWGRARLEIEDTGGKARRCTEAFADIDDTVDRTGSRDAQAAPIPGFPHLRATRFLAALGTRFLDPRKEENNDKAFDFWTDWLADTAIKARRYELANLSHPARVALRKRLGKRPETMIEECTAFLINFDKQRRENREILAGTVKVPDNYIDIQRIIGIYPLTAIPVLLGFEIWKEQNLPSFSRAPSDLQTRGTVIRFAPPVKMSTMPPEEVADLLRQSADNSLNVPRPTDEKLRRLAAAFAPVFAIDVAGTYDRIGTPVAATNGTPGLDPRTPRIYVQPSWAIVDGVPMLQISYLAWFSARPPRGSLDILAGRMDGLIWRITIAPDGRPMLYDSIHPCGCYHLFFPVPPTQLRDHPINQPREGTVVPTNAPTPGPGQRMVLHLGSGDHYLRALSVKFIGALSPTRYELTSMDNLRSLPLATGGTRSLFDHRGIVVGTERNERFLLWPMGVLSPAAMRQWGTHATAFVGRRHFDDPYLIDGAFTR